MRALLRFPSIYLGLPLLFACALTCITYTLPIGYAEGLWLLAGAALIIMLLDLLATVCMPDRPSVRLPVYVGTRGAFIALAFACAIVAFCLLDLTLFPIPLISNPTSYANLQGGREHVRHISDMCWVLPPIGMLCVRHRAVRYALIAVGLLFPVLVIDRNRVLAALFASALVIALRRDSSKPLPWKTISVLLVAGCVVFSVLGILRSGTLDYVSLPFSPLFRAAPQGFKWLLLYVTAGPYNFGAILAKHYVNNTFLFNQLVPLSGSIATAGTGIPLDASNINVGTEFFPFLMAWGPLGAIGAMWVLYAMMAWSVRLLVRGMGLFPLLIFLRMSYVCVMAPFAPQAFTWTNLGFIALCLLMQMVAAWLPNRRAHRGQGSLPAF